MKQAQLALSTKNLTKDQMNEVLVNAGLIASEDTIKIKLLQSALAKTDLSVTTQNAILSELGLMNATTLETYATESCTKEQLLNILATKGVTGANAEAIISTLGLSSANTKATLSFSLLGKSIKSTFATLLTNPLTWVIAGLVGVVTVAHKTSQAVKEIHESAQELGAAFKETKSDIEDYKTRIEELYATINDSSSSFSDVTEARKSLLSIQDELIEKYGSEKGAITDITDAINGQTDALDNLTQKQWTETKNEFNDSGFWNDIVNKFKGYKDNIERMESEYGDYTAKINLSRTGMDASELEKLMETLRTVYGAKITTFYDGSLMAEFNGDAAEVYNTLYEIQNLSSRFNFSDSLEKQLTIAANYAKEIADQYADYWEEHVLNDKIFADKDYNKIFKNLLGAYDEYSDAKLSGDEAKIKEYSDAYAKLLSESLQNVEDEDVSDFFMDMYPELKETFADYDFKIKFTPDIADDGFDECVSAALDKLNGKTKEEILGLNMSVATDEQIQGYDELDAIAREYGQDLEWLLSLLEEMGEVQSESYQQLIDTFGEENIKKIAPEDLEIAYTINNVGNMTFEQFQNKIQKEKERAEELENISFTEAISQVEALSKGFDQLNKIYADVSDKEDFDWSSILNNDDFLEAFGDMENVTGHYKDVYDKFIESVSNSPNDLNGCQKAFNELATAYIMNSGILDNVTEETKAVTAAMLEQMGIANADELVTYALAKEKMQAALASYDFENASLSLKDAMLLEVAALELSETEMEIFTNAYSKAQAYMTSALNNGANARLQKLGLEISSIKSYADALNVIAQINGGCIDNWMKDADGYYGNSAWIGYLLKFGAALDQANAAIERAMNTTAEITGGSPTKSAGSSGSGSSGSGSGSASQSIETFNFIEIAITRIEEKIDKLKTKAGQTFRYFTARGKAYAKSISKITTEISLQKQARDAYMARANSYGLDEAWAAQVRDGSVSIADIADNGLKEQISGYKEWYEKALECKKTLKELKTIQKELKQEKIELLVTKYDKLLSRLEGRMERIEHVIDYKETWGRSANTGNYNSLNKNLQSQISYTIKQNAQLRKLKKEVKKGSEAWYEYNERITSNNQSIQELTKSMAENATAAASLAGQKAEKQNNREDRMDEKIDAQLSTTPTTKRQNKLITKKLMNIDDRQTNLKKAYTTTKKTRNKYGKKILSAVKKGGSSKNKKLFASAKSYVKKKKLIPASLLNKIVSAMKTATGTQYNSLNKLLSYCNNYNANKNAEEENRQLYEIYALTAQADKAELRQEQLQSNLDQNQAKADQSTITAAETTAAKNHNLDVQIRQNNANAKSYETATNNAASDREMAAKKADFSSTDKYEKLKNKKLKARLKKAISAIKAGAKIDSDSLKAVKKYCTKYLNGNMKYYINCLAYNSAVENELNAQEAETLAKAEYYAANLQAKREKAANTAAGREAQNELYSATAANQTTAKAKNSYVDKQIANLNSNLSTYKTDYNDAVTDYNTAKSTVTKTSSTDKSKQSTINTIKKDYVNKNILIPAEYIEEAYTVSNAFGLACVYYNEALESKNAALETYNLYEQTSRTEKAALALEKMANTESEYSNKQGEYEQRSQRLNSAIELAQAKGYEVSKVYYNKLIQEESAINSSLAAERQALIDSLDESVANSTIPKYSDDWYEACAKIDDVTNSLDESTKSLVEFQNQLRQIAWDNFDYLESHIKNVTSEISFLIDELSREDLASDETGRLTERGNAVAVLRSASYESYQKQANDYADEISRIDEDLAKDENKYNKTLLERRDELVQSYQDCVKGAQDEKYAIIELYEQGYDALQAKIKKLISEYEGLLDTEKDAYDYQNDIADKTKEIASLRKQLQAYAGDISEETRAKVQTLKVSLEEAEKDLTETQYEKYISDTKEMLSDLEEDLEEAIQTVIDSLSENFNELLKGIDSYYQEACDTITEVSTGIGYTPTEDFKNLLDNTTIASAVTSMLAEIKGLHEDMTSNADDNANHTDYGAAAGGEVIYNTSDGAILTPLGQGNTVFTIETVERLMGLNQAIMPDITKTATVNLPKAELAGKAGDVTIHMGGIVMNGVNDPKEFEANLVAAVNNSSRVKKAVSNNVLGPLTNGYNSLSGHMYAVH